MGISHTQQLKLKPDENGNEKWILPHGVVLQVEDSYIEYFKGRRINYVFLSNKIDMEAIILTDKEKARKKIKSIIKEKITQKPFLEELDNI